MHWRGYVLVALCFVAWSGIAAEAKRGSGRFEGEIRAFEMADRQRPPEPGGIVFVGSSSIRKWETLQEDFPGVDVLGRGFGGSEIADATFYADRIIVPYRPRQVVLYAGDNDIAAGRSAEEVLEEFRGFVLKVRGALPQTKVSFISIKPSLARWGLVDRMRAANELVRKECSRSTGLEFIDIFGAMLGPDGKPRQELLVRDGLHMSREGYALWARIIGPKLSKKEEKGERGK